MKTKLFILALCTVYQTPAAQQLSLEGATKLLESTCRFIRGVDYIAPGTENPQVTRSIASRAIQFLHDNKVTRQQPTEKDLEACKTCGFTTQDGQISAAVWDAAKNLKQEKYGHDYMSPCYTLSTQ